MPKEFRRTTWKRLAISGLTVVFFLLLLVAVIAHSVMWIPSPAFWIAEMSIVFALIVLFIGDRLDFAYQEATRRDLG
jgi:uncharacterized RDD family membrane protein YckC